MKQVSKVTPAKAAEEEPDGEGAQHSSHGEDGHRERPERGQGVLRDGLGKPAAPRLIVEALNDLQHRHNRQPLFKVSPGSSQHLDLRSATLTFCGALITPVLYPNWKEPITAVPTASISCGVTCW